MAELPALQELHAKLEREGLLVVGVAVDDSLEELKAAIARYGLTYPIMLDNQGRSKRLFELKGYPESFVLDGDLRVRIIGDLSNGAPVTKIIGPREWGAPRGIATFRGLLSNPNK
jgi:peroxiredoxin